MGQVMLSSPQSGWALIIAVVIFSATVLTAIKGIVNSVKIVVAPIREMIQEHDVLWEDYNIRVGGSYRRMTGRGAPPDPEEFYRKHPPEA